ncbi:MAG: CinA family protein [Wenzhouxiangellaceae bacterium]
MSPAIDDQALGLRAAALARELKLHGRVLALAESCTGGWIAKVCTDLAGSSVWFERGLVTYSNRAKSEELGVRPATIQHYGAVSEMVAAEMARGARNVAHADYAIAVSRETVEAMVQGACRESGADIGVAISGVAGPGGGSPDKPVGTVCFAWVGPEDEPETETCLFSGDREIIRRETVAHALDGLLGRM